MTFFRRVLCANGTIIQRLKDIYSAASSSSVTLSKKELEILKRWDIIVAQLERIHLHLFLLMGETGDQIDPGAVLLPKRGSVIEEEQMAFSGAQVTLAANETTANYTSDTAVPFDQETYDVDGWHDNVTNNSRLTVPSGVTRVRVGANIQVALIDNNEAVLFRIAKGGSTAWDGAAASRAGQNTGAAMLSIVTGPVDVVAGDYFEANLLIAVDTSVTITAANTNFWIEKVT